MASTNANCPSVAEKICETDVLSYPDYASLSLVDWESDKLYIDNATWDVYSWDGTQYVSGGSTSVVTNNWDWTFTHNDWEWSSVTWNSLVWAVNGTSLDSTGKVVLWNDVWATNAQLTSDREIPLNGNQVTFLWSQSFWADNKVEVKSWEILVSTEAFWVSETSKLNWVALEFYRGWKNTIQAVSQNWYISFLSTDWTWDSQGFVLDSTWDIYITENQLAQTAPVSPTGKNAKLYIENNDWDTVINSGLDDYSGIVITRLDTNTAPTAWLATIWIDNNWLVWVVSNPWASGLFTSWGQTITVTNWIITSII